MAQSLPIPSGVESATLRHARAALLDARTAAGRWEGCLSASALSTATAVLALAEVARRQRRGAVIDEDTAADLVRRGVEWLTRTQLDEGGWGDTPASKANVSTSALCWAALGVAEPTDEVRRATLMAERWLERASRGLAPRQLAKTLEARYGRDRTFSVPILTALAIAGRLGPDGWRVVPQLPFELAAFPPVWFATLRLPVVSYALPALIAIGQARHLARPSRNLLTRLARNATRETTLRKLEAIQPRNGGFLEATPLTSFVVMSLAAAGRVDLEVVRRGVAFIVGSMREDGGWPIDTNLSTWLTTLSVNALGAGTGLRDEVSRDERDALAAWLIDQQTQDVHPYTQAAAGAWAWTDLPGGVPDADDTAGALLALARLANPGDTRTRTAAARGVRWLLDLQNRDGGMPTFCRGWTGLPFDRSGADLTAHAVRAWLAWRPVLETERAAIDRALVASGRYLARVQSADGAFEPLWFGNEHTSGELNLTYGTAKVVPALLGLTRTGVSEISDRAGAAALRAERWLAQAQHMSGGWGGGIGASVCSIEETALAITAQAGFESPAARDSMARGVAWLRTATNDGREFPASPIGLYFAKLWYSERLYPLIFTVEALEATERTHGARGPND
jgi:squalene-hopene/tetraprenyl-beta-curcumene cyclase